MEQQTYRIRGREITPGDLDIIRSFVAAHWSKGRSAISRLLCEHWNWRQPNGAIKERAARVLLLCLEREGTIVLPPRLKNREFPAGGIGKKTATRRRVFNYDTTALDGCASRAGELRFSMVRRSADEAFWDHLIDTYHYLGNPKIVGSYLKHLVYLDGRLVAALGWGSAAWRVAARDSFIGWDNEQRLANLHKIAGNVRFLILPWVRVKNLASRVLAANVRRLPHDWQAFYNQPLALLETFVDTTRFAGTCYKAANWLQVGLTRGRGKYGPNTPTEPVKAVFLHPLRRDFRELLRGR
jgi:hypothetical protein